MNVILTNPRDIAVSALRDRAGNVSAHLDRLLDTSGICDVDKPLAREITLGVLRRRAMLEAVLQSFLERPDRRLPGSLNEILHVALYQILFMDRVPDFAAVNEAVEQASRHHHKRQGGLVNGVLRTVTRNVSALQEGTPPFGAAVLAVSPGSYRVFERPVFPDPQGDPGGYLAAAFSLPQLLAERWLRSFGPLEKAARLAAHSIARPPMILRVNRLKGDVDAAIAALASEGVEAVPHANGLSVVLKRRRNVVDMKAFRDGLCQPQDPTATAVVQTAAPRPGMKVLDFCAAPGTKTTHLAELMDNRGEITALDVSPEKLGRIDDNCRRIGVTIVTTQLAAAAGSLDPQSFDLVLVDAPCSNTGVLSRRGEARWRFDERTLAKLAKDQKALAAAGAGFVRRGGRLVYSTCSIEPEECGEVAHWLERRGERLEMVHEKLTLPCGADEPEKWCDGGYVAVFEAR
ncbi:MAG: methyltransferase domain-containing protein [Phycisphaerae bacterium]|nr:methyltransferase domain-containing protein [Phycisphaerae bacterium]